MMLAAANYANPDQDSVARNENQLIAEYLYLIKRAVNHLRSQFSTVQSQDDLMQIGTMGLLEAIRRYGSSPDKEFEGYAFTRIRGAILDELRRQDWRPRQARQQANQYNQAQRQLRRELGREATNQELMNQLNVDKQKLHVMQMDSVAEEMHSLDEMLSGGCEPGISTGQIEQHDIKCSVKQALTQLSQREQLLLTLYYQHELNLKEIALTLQLTESRVCQLHKQAVKELRIHLADLL